MYEDFLKTISGQPLIMVDVARELGVDSDQMWRWFAKAKRAGVKFKCYDSLMPNTTGSKPYKAYRVVNMDLVYELTGHPEYRKES